jgi:hypothetical protein
MSSVAVADTQPIEELALFNAALLALLVRRAAEEHERRSGGRPLPTMLAYLALPLALHGPTRRQLPSNVTAQMGEWIRAHPDAAAGLDDRARALLPLVTSGLRLGLACGLLVAGTGTVRERAAAPSTWDGAQRRGRRVHGQGRVRREMVL